MEPDLLWIESVTERLLGTAGDGWEPSTAEQIHGQHAEAPATGARPVPARPVAPAAPSPAPESPPPFVARGYAPAVRMPTEGVGPSGGPRPAAPSPAPPPGEEMPPGVLRAALRAALPDEVGRKPRPMDAVFGDPSWQLPPEDADNGRAADQPAPRPAPSGPTTGHSQPSESPPRAAARGETTGQRGEATGQHGEQPAETGRDFGPAPTGGGHRAPKPHAEPADIALRRAFLSGDEELAAAVVDLVGAQGQDQQRLRLVQAYLDALLAAGGEGVAGAARLRRLLDD